jgi:TetR/AcrR family transcriptional repressor of nem operon
VIRADRDAHGMADILFDGWQGAMLRMKVARSAAPLQAFMEETLRGYCGAGALTQPGA